MRLALLHPLQQPWNVNDVPGWFLMHLFASFLNALSNNLSASRVLFFLQISSRLCRSASLNSTSSPFHL
jgi:hypothetical protein